MLGISQRDRIGTEAAEAIAAEGSYEVYFGMGHVLRLLNRPDVFKVSPAGMSLGDFLVRDLTQDDLRGSLLDMGTGSGALAILLRGLGAHDITATDISASAVKTAMENELLNFGDQRISFGEGSLFDGPRTKRRFDLIVFNPPGWHSPSEECREELKRQNLRGLNLSAMFSGEKVAFDFLRQLPHHLTSNGRAIVGLNSMIGIRSVLSRIRELDGVGDALEFKLIERHTFPLFFYSGDWRESRDILLTEFHRWRDRHGIAFSVSDDGTLYWSYEVIECRLAAKFREVRA
ncbi:methyltransferase [Nonomuraea jiangxiensis]|uniref:Release factor glutamine methyltransferase n=1 Tax=Nonomuraea jiangxiensis TaxID=633440 RepID=A0A1G8TFZ5_9ACTN|nr:methyltransferase [Nonomuraea jiangxiensis]SDJ40519.1 release factor glutamine methyltransferase [Nonomuraea jiangxiensis]